VVGNAGAHPPALSYVHDVETAVTLSVSSLFQTKAFELSDAIDVLFLCVSHGGRFCRAGWIIPPTSAIRAREIEHLSGSSEPNFHRWCGSALLLLAIGPALDVAGLAEAAGVPLLMAAWAAAVVLIDRIPNHRASDVRQRVWVPCPALRGRGLFSGPRAIADKLLGFEVERRAFVQRRRKGFWLHHARIDQLAACRYSLDLLERQTFEIPLSDVIPDLECPFEAQPERFKGSASELERGFERLAQLVVHPLREHFKAMTSIEGPHVNLDIGKLRPC
jgi:hypothetical protein